MKVACARTLFLQCVTPCVLAVQAVRLTRRSFQQGNASSSHDIAMIDDFELPKSSGASATSAMRSSRTDSSSSTWGQPHYRFTPDIKGNPSMPKNTKGDSAQICGRRGGNSFVDPDQIEVFQDFMLACDLLKETLQELKLKEEEAGCPGKYTRLLSASEGSQEQKAGGATPSTLLNAGAAEGAEATSSPDLPVELVSGDAKDPQPEEVSGCCVEAYVSNDQVPEQSSPLGEQFQLTKDNAGRFEQGDHDGEITADDKGSPTSVSSYQQAKQAASERKARERKQRERLTGKVNPMNAATEDGNHDEGGSSDEDTGVSL
ncbi:unnamed protein product [Amoebophrya sp. A25]|nr:unnamed protein product [Amoebophrya sp. A25]|eukprot:GSA25T00017535001.1